MLDEGRHNNKNSGRACRPSGGHRTAGTAAGWHGGRLADMSLELSEACCWALRLARLELKDPHQYLQGSSVAALAAGAFPDALASFQLFSNTCKKANIMLRPSP